MNKYSRINSKGKSESILFSNNFSFPLSQTQTPQKISKPHQEKSNKNEFSKKSMNFHYGSVEDQEKGEEENGEMFGVILSRSRSVQSMAEKKEVKRTCSMKRSSSVSSAGGYCRIHHQNDYPISDEETHENFNVVHSKQRKKEKGKILIVCMRLLGF
ncbi:hypothetical protein A4A49_09582 [Nicotiana attenuata]|uniref:Uncharacterized protein n=1 Tax=Nicotiana attenuata TaxID=49451 RepID=A0A1J6J2U4_NICAT|nr:hypothetical protein A4A49_09582 [Nicotiana attenuata]